VYLSPFLVPFFFVLPFTAAGLETVFLVAIVRLSFLYNSYTDLSLCSPCGKFISNVLVPSFHLVHDGQAPSFSLEAVFCPSNRESIYHFASSLESISHPGLVMELLSNGQEPIFLLPNVREPIRFLVAEVLGPVSIYYPSRYKGHLLEVR
jgi:hypothetical protein